LKLLVTSDLHYNLQQFDWLLQTADRYDYVVLAGDLLNVAGYLELEVQITVISEYLQTLSQRTKVIACSGNHDGENKTRSGEYTATWMQGIATDRIFVDWQHVHDDDTAISVCPWWDGPESRQAMAEMLAEHSQHPAKKWVWVHHAPPDACRVSWTGKRHGGDRFLNQLIELYHPTVVFSGHIHTAPFYQVGGWVDRIGKTWVCNPGHQPGPVPTTIQFDLSTMMAVFDSSEGRETADLSDLDAPLHVQA
tara:strand:+ start:869 stop:1618 length:750 start_codon:yes stop_codon:yes gene_type:complete